MSKRNGETNSNGNGNGKKKNVCLICGEKLKKPIKLRRYNFIIWVHQEEYERDCFQQYIKKLLTLSGLKQSVIKKLSQKKTNQQRLDRHTKEIISFGWTEALKSQAQMDRLINKLRASWELSLLIGQYKDLDINKIMDTVNVPATPETNVILVRFRQSLEIPLDIAI